MEKFKLILAQVARYLLAIFMIFGGVQHFLNAEFYEPFVPSFLPNAFEIILISGAVEIILGIGLLFTARFAKYAALGVLALMIAFLPIHIQDVFIDNPAIGSHKAALIRLPVQFVFIAWSYFVYAFLKRR